MTFSSEELLNQHENIHISSSGVPAIFGPGVFLADEDLLKHKYKTTPESKENSNVATTAVYVPDGDLRTKVTSPVEPSALSSQIACTDCGKTFKTEKIKQAHLRNVHAKVGTTHLDCWQCSNKLLSIFRKRSFLVPFARKRSLLKGTIRSIY
jgi:DNA-directed RNA polymerase subunit RPC12/RpoP